jgi:hypothetical protein
VISTNTNLKEKHGKTRKNMPKNSENMLLDKLKARRSTHIETKTKIDVKLLAVYYHTVYTQTI